MESGRSEVQWEGGIRWVLLCSILRCSGPRGTRAAFRLVLNRRGKDVNGRQQRL